MCRKCRFFSTRDQDTYYETNICHHEVFHINLNSENQYKIVHGKQYDKTTHITFYKERFIKNDFFLLVKVWKKIRNRLVNFEKNKV